jgi:LysM repeat protein
MDQNPDREMQELMEEIAEDLGYASKKQEEGPLKGNPEETTNKRRTLILGGAGILLLILLSVWLFGGPEESSSREDWAALSQRIDQIENRLGIMEESRGKIAYLEEQEKSLSKSFVDTEASIRALRDRLDQVSQRAERFEKTSPASGGGALKTPPAPSPATRVTATKRYHEVRKGDTLYGISKKYGVSIEDLRRLNQLGKTEAILPGRKLTIE